MLVWGSGWGHPWFRVVFFLFVFFCTDRNSWSTGCNISRILHSLNLKEEGPYFGRILALGEHTVSKTKTRLYSVLLDAFFCCAPQSCRDLLCYSLKLTNISLNSRVCESCPVPVLVLTPLFVLLLLLMWSGHLYLGGRGNARPRSHDRRRWQDLNAAGAHWGS